MNPWKKLLTVQFSLQKLDSVSSLHPIEMKIYAENRESEFLIQFGNSAAFVRRVTQTLYFFLLNADDVYHIRRYNPQKNAKNLC